MKVKTVGILVIVILFISAGFLSISIHFNDYDASTEDEMAGIDTLQSPEYDDEMYLSKPFTKAQFTSFVKNKIMK